MSAAPEDLALMAARFRAAGACEVADSFDKVGEWLRTAERVQAEVDRRVAEHPDLAELNDFLDNYYPHWTP